MDEYPDVFLGEVPIVPYDTPGTAAFAQAILPFVYDSNARERPMLFKCSCHGKSRVSTLTV